MKRKQKRIESTQAWAWSFNTPHDLLCCWACESKERLLLEAKPSPEARPVRVRIVRDADWRRMQKLANRAAHITKQ